MRIKKSDRLDFFLLFLVVIIFALCFTTSALDDQTNSNTKKAWDKKYPANSERNK